jgi:hypothetical protein
LLGGFSPPHCLGLAPPRNRATFSTLGDLVLLEFRRFLDALRHDGGWVSPLNADLRRAVGFLRTLR